MARFQADALSHPLRLAANSLPRWAAAMNEKSSNV